jgi:hypothetical protein
MARVLGVVSDLMLASRVEGSLSAAGHDVRIEPALPEAVEADVIVCDLDVADPAAIVATGLPALGFYAHTDLETRRRAEEAGLQPVVPRSRMARDLVTLVDGLLGPGAGHDEAGSPG